MDSSSSVQVQFKVNANQYEYINQECVYDNHWIDPTKEQIKVLKMPKGEREKEKQKYNDMVAGNRKGEVFLVDDPGQCALDGIDKCKPNLAQLVVLNAKIQIYILLFTLFLVVLLKMEIDWLQKAELRQPPNERSERKRRTK